MNNDTLARKRAGFKPMYTEQSYAEIAGGLILAILSALAISLLCLCITLI